MLISSHVLAEVAQTVDQVLIINHGKLVVESSLEQLTARVGGSVRVRTPEREKLRQALQQERIETTTVNDQATARARGEQREGRRSRVRGRRADPRARRRRLVARRRLPRAHLGTAAVIDQIKAELLKIRSTRTTIGIVLGMLALVLLFSLLSGLLTKPPGLMSTEDQRGLLGVGSLAGVFSALAGIMLVTSEYRFGTIRPTFLFTPRRSRVIAAKLAAGLLTGIVFGIVGEGLGFAIGYATLAGRGIDYALNAEQTTLLVLGTLAGVALWGALGVGVGVIVRNQVGAIIGLLAWGFVAENLLFAFVPSVGRFAPVHAQNALMGLTGKHLLPAAAGGAMLLAWTIAFALIGVGLVARRDVN